MNYIAFLRNFLQLSPEEQEKQKSQYSKAMLQQNDKLTDIYLSDRTEGSLNQMRVILDLLDTGKISEILGGKKVIVPLASLSEVDQGVLMQFSKQYDLTSLANLNREPSSSANTSITMYSKVMDGSKKHIMPNVYLLVGNSAGLTRLGPGVSMGFKQSLARAWIMPGDLKSHWLEDRIIPKPASKSKSTEENTEVNSNEFHNFPLDRIYEKRLTSLSSLVNIPIIGILNREDRRSRVDPVSETTVKKFLFDTEYGLSVLKMHKWRKGVLLISTPDWMMSQESVIAIDLIKKMQALLNKPSREGLLKEVCNQFVTLSLQKWEGLVQRFPMFSIVVRNPSFFRFAANYSDLFRSTGLELNEDIIQAIVSCLPETNRKTLDNARKVRWRTVNARMKKEDNPIFAFEVLDSKGAWKELVSSAYLSVMDGSDYSPQ